MLVGDKFHSYRKASRSVLGVSCGPAGWLFATWSYIHSASYELTISDSSGTTLGSVAVQLDDDSTTSDLDVCALCGRQRNIAWHPSGTHVAVVESGKVIVIGIKWTIASNPMEYVSFERVGEVFHARQGIATDPDGSSRTDHVGDELQATVTLLRQSICVGATTLSVSHTLLGPMHTPQSDTAGGGVQGSLLIGTGEGAILLTGWNSGAEPVAVHSEARNAEGADVATGTMPAVVLVPAQAATVEDRDLLRPWQPGSYALSSAAPPQSHSPSPIPVPALVPQPGAAQQEGVLAPVIDIGDGFSSAAWKGIGDDSSAGLEGDCNGFIHPFARESPALLAPCSVQTLSFDDKSRTLVATYGDGSIAVAIVKALGEGSSLTGSPPLSLRNATTVALHVVSTARLHPVLRVAYPLYPTVAGVGPAADPRPAVYELGAAGAYRSSSFVTEQDVRALLDLTPSLLHKVCRMRSLVTGRAEDEICRVLGAELVRGADGLQILCLVQSRHLPAHAFAVGTTHKKDFSGTAIADNGGEEEAGERYESFSLLLLAVTAQAGGEGVGLECLQSACVERAGAGRGVCSSRLLEVVRLPQGQGAHVLVLHSDGRITCRALSRLSSALFSVQTEPAPDPEKASADATRSGGLTVVSATVGTGNIIVSQWSPKRFFRDDVEADLESPLTGAVQFSRLIVIPLLVSVHGGVFPGQAAGLFVDLADGFIAQAVVDTEQRHVHSQSRAVAGAEVFGRFSAPSRLWRLPLPRALQQAVHKYRMTCGPAQYLSPCLHGGLLAACSEQQLPGFGAVGSEERYLAVAAGGGWGPGRRALQAQRKTSGELQLWVYNCRTRRWRAVSLCVGAPGSSAQVLKLEFSFLAAAGVPERSTSQESLSRTRDGPRVLERRRSSDDASVTLRAASADGWMSNAAPLLPLPVRESPKANGHSVVSPRSHLSGDPSAMLSLAWFGTHSLLLLTIRRSACCLEIVSRELTKSSVNAGTPVPATHRLLLLPPGYQPTGMHVILHPGTTERCSVVLFDGTTLLCYRVAATMRSVDRAREGAPPAIAQVADYGVEEEWDASVTALVPTKTRWFIAKEEEVGIPHGSGEPPAGSLDRATGGEHSSVALPVLEILPFLQTAAFYRSQAERFQGTNSPQQGATLVALMLLDSKGAVWYADPERRTCMPVSAGPVAALSHLEMLHLSRSETCLSATEMQPRTSAAFLLHHIPDRSAQANSRLLYIFQKTSLAQHLSPAGAALVERCTMQRSTLWLPVTWSSPSTSRSASCSDAELSDAGPVHHPTDADLLAPRLSLSAGPQDQYSALTLSLPPLPPHAQPLVLARDGTHTLLTRRNLDVTVRPGSRSSPTGAPQLLFLSLLSEAVVAAMETDAGERRPLETAEVHTRPPELAVRLLIRALVAGWIREIRLQASGTGHFVAYLELLIHRWAETAGFTHEHPEYVNLAQSLACADAALLCELVSRLGRKLEPSVSHRLFPVAVAAESDPLGVVPLYEACRAAGHIDHAARTLSLACDAVGGTASHISTVASLFIALDYLADSAGASSLRCFAECLRFCSRLERTLLEHSTSIFGATSSGASLLDDSYRRTVKGRAIALIAARAATRGGQAGSPTGANTQRAPSIDAGVMPAAPAPSPAGRFYLGMGVKWVLAKAAQSFLPQPEQSLAQDPSDSPTIRPPSVSPDMDRGQGGGRPQLPPLNLPIPSCADPEQMSSMAPLQSLILGPSRDLVPPCSAVAAIEAKVGTQELNALLTPREALDQSAASVTALSLSLIFEGLFRSSSHYCNAAVLMYTVQQEPTVFSAVRRIAGSGEAPLGSQREPGVPSPERVRRMLFAFGLSRAVSRALDVPAMLASPILPQYLRRMVGADSSHLPVPSPLSTHVPTSARSAYSRTGSWSASSSAKGAFPFTPPPQVTAGRKVPLLHADYFELAAPELLPDGAPQGRLTLLALLKALALALMFVHDNAAAGLLLTALAPFLPHVDPALHAALTGLPVPAAAPTSNQPDRDQAQGRSEEQDQSAGKEQELQARWDLSIEQRRSVIDALCRDT